MPKGSHRTQFVFFFLFLCFGVLKATFDAEVSLHLSELSPSLVAVNRKIFGNNNQWPDYGDGLVTVGFSGGFPTWANQTPEVWNPSAGLKSGVIRYPGGSYADVYHWQAGIGAGSIHYLPGRAQCESGPGNFQYVIYGTQEFLELCEASNAEPLITVNILTGTPQEAADWVNYVNIQRINSSVTGNPLPKVTYWEIGNEPYLYTAYNLTSPTPYETAATINQFIDAMKAVDPSIQVGIPLSSEKVNGRNGNDWAGVGLDYQKILLQQVNSTYEWVAKHNAYLPLGNSLINNDTELWYSSMAGYKTVDADFEFTLSQVSTYRPSLLTTGVKLFGITEYNNLILSPLFAYTASYMSAVYIADILRYFTTERDDILMANYWSMSGNGMFGAVWTDGVPRPAYHMLHELSDYFNGYILPLDFTSPNFSSPSIVFSAAQPAVPLVTGMATTTPTQNGWKVKVLLINKHLTDDANVTFSAPDSLGLSLLSEGTVVSLREFYAADISTRWANYDAPGAAASIGWVTLVANQTVSTLSSNGVWTVSMKAHSVLSIELEVPAVSSPASSILCYPSFLTFAILAIVSLF